MSWPKVRLGDVCEVKAGRDYKDVESPDGKYPIYGTGGVMGMSREWRCPAGSVIVGRKGTLDNPMLINEPFWNIDTCFGVVPSDKLLPAYLWRFCQNFDFYSLVPASGRPSTTSDAVKAIKLPLPPLVEQKKIVEKVEKALKRVDALKAQFERMEKSAADYFKAALAETFAAVKGEKVKLEDICEFIKDGTHQTPQYTTDIQSGYKFVSSKDVTSGAIDWEHLKYIPARLHDELYARIAPKKGDILLAKNGTTGVAAIVDRDEIFDIYVSVALLRFKAGNCLRYLWYIINSPLAKAQFNRRLKGIGVPNLHLEEIRKVEIVVPPVAVQQQVIASLDAAKAKSERMVAAARRCIGICGKMRKAILAEAFQ